MSSGTHRNDLTVRHSARADAGDLLSAHERGDVSGMPDDWDVSTVGREFEIQLGKMLDAARNTGVPKPYIGNRSVQWGRVDVAALSEVLMTPTDVSRFRLRQNDLLVCEGGEVGRAAIWNDPIAECFYQKALHRLRPKGAYDVRLMMSFLQLWASTGYLENFVTQTSIAHLPKDRLEAIPLPVPTTEEQRVIAEALSDVDGLLGALGALIAKKWAIKQAAMQQLLTGKTRLPGFSGEWETKRLGDLGYFLKGSGVTRDDALSGPLACVRYGEIYTTHNDYIRAFHSWISPEVAATATRLEVGDLLFAGSGETKEEIGKCVAFVLDVEAYAGGDIVIVRPSSVDSLFLGYALNTSDVARQKASFGQGDAVVHISASALAQVSVQLPGIREQNAISTVLSEMDAEIAALEARRDKTRAIKQGMMQQLLTGRVRLVKPKQPGAA